MPRSLKFGAVSDYRRNGRRRVKGSRRPFCGGRIPEVADRRCPKPVELARVEKAQQLDLQREIDVSDFIQEQDDAVCRLEAPLLVASRFRKTCP